MTTSIPYQFPVRIEADDIDFMGHVNNATYLRWVQEATISHWRSFAPAEAVEAYVWVAVKHEITYRKPAFLGDEVITTVLLRQVRRESAFYETLIRRGNELLAEVQSRWCCLDAKIRRPTRLPKDVTAPFFRASE